TEALDPITTGAAAAIEAAEASSQTLSANARPQRRATAAAAASTAAVVTAPAPTATPAPEPVSTPAPTPPAAPAPSLNNPYVQVGLFTVEANASAAATGLRQGGIVPTIVPGTNATGSFWRVLVGPMTSAEDQTEILSQVKSLGYSDAFLVSN
ncbi:MAG: SPOR domain-containing protein, partial [Boseongicola sp.]|nr:SPOR domain-containing protein [Boseongicola sp.]